MKVWSRREGSDLLLVETDSSIACMECPILLSNYDEGEERFPTVFRTNSRYKMTRHVGAHILLGHSVPSDLLSLLISQAVLNGDLITGPTS